MILESMLRIAAAKIKTEKTLPHRVIVVRGKLKFSFNREEIMRVASRVSKTRRSRKLGVEHDKYIIKQAGYKVYKKRLNSPAAGWCLKECDKKPLHPDHVMDVRHGYQSELGGLGRERLMAIFDPMMDIYKTTSHHYAFIKAIGDKVIIVDTKEEALDLQYYLAKKSLLNPVLCTEEVEGFWDGVKVDGFVNKGVVAHG